MFAPEIFEMFRKAFTTLHPKYPFPTTYKDAPKLFKGAIDMFTVDLNNVIRESNVEWIKAQKDMYQVEFNHKARVQKALIFALVCMTLLAMSSLVALGLIANGIVTL